MSKSALQIARASYVPKTPQVLNGNVQPREGAATESVRDQEEIKKLFPNTYGMPIIAFEEFQGEMGLENPVNVGVILSGGQAPGGHNVIAGIFDGSTVESDSRLYGFHPGVLQDL